MPRIGTICFWFIFMNRLVNFCITLQLIVAISFQRVLQAAIALVHSLAFALRLLCSGICCGVNLLLAISRRNRRGCTTLGPPLGTHTSSRAAAPFVIVPLLFWSASDSGWALFFYFYYVFFFRFCGGVCGPYRIGPVLDFFSSICTGQKIILGLL